MSREFDEGWLAEIRDAALDDMVGMPRSFGRYEVLGELGRGGMGIVYDAHDPYLGRRVAVKVIHGERLGAETRGLEAVIRFQREMKATSDLVDPHVVSIFDAGIERLDSGPVAFYVMERVEGVSLERTLQERGSLPVERAVEIARDAAQGLAVVHARGLVHRDLKPANVLLASDGRAKLSDFGLCSVREEIGASGEDPGIRGTPHYIAPEQIRREPIDQRADLFSLGSMIVRMLSGREPFQAADLDAHFERILRDDPDGLDTLPDEIRALVSDLVQKDPALRPSAADAARRLAELCAPESSRVRGRTPRRALRWVAGTIVIAIAAGGVLLRARTQLVELDEAVRDRHAALERQLERRDRILERWLAVATRDGAKREKAAESLGLPHEIAGARSRALVERERYEQAAALLNARRSRLPWKLVARSIDAWPAAGPHVEGDLDLDPRLERSAAAGRRIHDLAGLLDPQSEALLDERLALLERESGIDVRLVSIAEPWPAPPEIYSAHLFDRLASLEAISPRGILVAYSQPDASLRVEVGYELEALVSDDFAGDWIERHARPLFADGDPASALLLGVRMVHDRIRRAQLAGLFDPNGAVPQTEPHPSGGAGAQAVAVLGGRSPSREPGSAELANPQLGPAASPGETYARYERWLEQGTFVPRLDLFTPATQRLLAEFPITPAYFDHVYFREHGRRVEIAQDGDLALVYATDDPLLPPHFLRHTASGWRIDLVAREDEVIDFVGGVHSWGLRAGGEFATAFRDRLVSLDGTLRLADGANTPLPLLAQTGE